MASIRLDELTKRFDSDDGPLVAVDELSLEIRDGEFVVLVGPSGCGKTTTLRCIAGLEDVTDGRILMDERDISSLDPADRNMAMVFQNFALYPHMTARENISFGLRLSGQLTRDDITDHVEEVASMLDIKPYLDMHPSQLSGGQKQRVALGRAVIREPDVFLFDEPLSNLDAKLRTNMRTEIQRLQNHLGTTAIYVTHDQVEAMTMGDRIAVLKDGCLQQVGPPQEIYEHPVNLFVAGFIGEPSMNFTRAQVTASDDEGDLVLADDTVYRVTDELTERIEAQDSTQVTLGIRPEHISIVDTDEELNGANRIDSTVSVLEQLGDQNIIYYDVAGVEFTTIVDGSFKPEVGSPVHVTFREEDVYLFDDSGDAIKTRNDDKDSMSRKAQRENNPRFQ